MSKKLFYLIFILFITLQLSTVSARTYEFSDLNVGVSLGDWFNINVTDFDDSKNNYLGMAFVDENDTLMSLYLSEVLTNDNNTNLSYVDLNVIYDNKNKVENLITVHSWKLNEINNVESFCSTYNEISSLQICNKLENDNYYFLVIKIDRPGPRFEFNCTPKKVKVGEEFVCSLSTETEGDAVHGVSFSLNDSNFDVKLMELADKWEDYSGESSNDFAFVGYDNPLSDGVILKLTLVSKHDLSGDYAISLNRFMYGFARGGDEGGFSGSANYVFDTINIAVLEEKIPDDETNVENDKEAEKNPNTSDIGVVFILFSLMLSGIICLKLSNKLLMK